MSFMNNNNTTGTTATAATTNGSNTNNHDESHTNRYYTSTMQWSECIPNTTSQSSPIGSNNEENVISLQQQQAPLVVGGIPQHQHHHHQHHQHQPLELPPSVSTTTGSTGSSTNTCAAPTIKNHSVTHLGRYLYCFGGYDGRRNHTTLLIYDLTTHRWIRPIHCNTTTNTNTNSTTSTNNHMNHTSSVVSATNHQGTGGTGDRNSTGSIMMSDMIYQQQQQLPVLNRNNDDDDDDYNNPHAVLLLQQQQPNRLRHPSYPYVHHHSDSIIIQGTPPPGRNGHSATLAIYDDNDDYDDDGNNNSSNSSNGRIVIIGGWLGTGPLAASDTHILDVSCNGKLLRWYQPTIHGTPPGPCNMHSADYVSHRKEVYVFRGGNGREYLNDLHALHVPTVTWRKVMTTGEVPQQRANHSSAILEETNELFIFGGWNGTERLNDIHILDTMTSTWSYPKIYGILPHPRAGMTLTALRGRLYLFGGSGQLAKCFYDLQIFDRASMTWLDVSQMDHDNNNNNNNGGDDNNSLTGGGNNTNNINNNNNNNIASNSNNAIIPNHHRYHHQSEPQFIYGGNQQQYRHGSQYGTHNTTSIFGGFQFDDTFEPQQAGGVQEGSSINNNNININNDQNTMLALPDWRSREHQHRVLAQHQHQQLQHISPNPNDEDTVPSVLVHGHGPARRAGHTATAVGRQIYIFGGSYGSKYLNDFFILDTDPPPQAIVTESNSLQLIERRLRHFFNDEEFADVTFTVQGQKVYGHKMILSIVSECFRAMFTTGFRESDEHDIEIQDCTYAAFVAVMEYIYTGTLPSSLVDVTLTNNRMLLHTGDVVVHPQQQYQYRASSSTQLVRVVEILELADRFFLDHLKQICESKLQNAVTVETVEYLLPVAQKTNSYQLQSICEHLMRNK